MAENKLLGKLTLDAKDVLATITKVNNELKNLGKGVDLDLTKILNAKVNTQLENLKKQIEEVSRAATGQTTAQRKQAQEAKNLLDQQNKAELIALEDRAAKLREYGKAKIAYEKQQIKERETLEKNYDKEWQNLLKNQEKAAEKAAKAEADAAKKAAQEKAEAERQAAREREAALQRVEQMANRAITVIGRISLQFLREQFQEAINYATQYYDALNEIRVVTGMTEQAANRLGNTYRQMAQSMSVTSTELASAAVTFYRQGLNDSQVQNRLEWVTKYAKVASISFESAAELITASANAMSEDIQGDIQRVVDVFLYLGDNAATTGEEVGKAMQKASASATEFGVSFEWLGSWIATVSEQTRQAPETIGNAFNSMMARLHSIRQTGFNSEDETTINNVAKALKEIGVTLMDQEGNWRDMTDIFNDVAEQWDNLTGKEKSYIATTVAGVRQQNVFFALMNDLSKGIENGSRAWELYTGALNAAGTATEKYATWQESVAASQANLTNSLESLYAQLQPGIIKGFYDVVSWLVDGISTLAGPVVIGAAVIAIGALINTIVSFYTTMQGVTGFMATSAAVFNAHPLFMTATVIVGILALTGVLGGLWNSISGGTQELEDYNKTLEETNSKIEKVRSLQQSVTNTFQKMQSGTSLTNVEVAEYNSNLQQLSSLSPAAYQAVQNLTGGVEDQTTAFNDLNAAINNVLNSYTSEQQAEARQALRHYKAPDSVSQVGSAKNFLNHMNELFPDVDPQNIGELISRYVSWLQTLYDDEWWNEVADYGLPFDTSIFNSLIAGTNIGAVEDAIWTAMFGGDNSMEQFEKNTQAEVNKLVDLAMIAIGDVGSALKESAIRETLSGLIVDEFGFLYEDAAQRLLDSITDVDSLMETGWARNIAKYVFGDEFIAGMDEATEYALDVLDANPMVEDLANMIEELIKLGWSKVDLANFLGEDPLGWDSAWGNVLSASGYKTFQTLDDETLILLLDLNRLGVAAEDVNQAFENADGDQRQYIKNLKALRTVFNETSDSLATVASAVNTLSYVEKIDSMLSGINKNHTYDLNSLLEIAKVNPEILASAEDIDTLRVALESIKHIQLANLRQQFTDMVSSIEGIDPDDVASIVDSLMKLTESDNNTSSSDSANALNDLQSKMKLIKELMQAIEENGGLSFDQIVSLGSIDQSLLAYINNMHVLYSRLKSEHNKVLAEQRSFWEEYVANSSAFFQGDLYQALSGYGVSTLQGAVDLLSSDEFIAANGEAKAAAMLKYANEQIAKWAQELLNAAQASTQETTDPLAEFISEIDMLNKASQALEVIQHPESNDATQLADAWETILSIFPDLDAATVTVEDVQTAVDNLDASVRNAANDFGVLGAMIIASMNGQPQTWQQTVHQNSDKVSKAQSYLDDLDATKSGYSSDKALTAFEELKKMFPELDKYGVVSETFIAEAQGYVDALNDMVNRTLSNVGIVSDETASKMQEDAKAAEEALTKEKEAFNSLLEAIRAYNAELEVNHSSQTGFVEQLNELSAALESEGVERAKEIWAGYTEEMRNAITKEYPALAQAIRKVSDETGDLAEETEDLSKELSNARWKTGIKTFTNTAKAVGELERYTMNASDAYAAFYSEAEKAITAQSEYLTATDKMADGVEVASDDVKTLADFLGFATPDALLQSWDQVGPMLASAMDEGVDALNRLNEAAFINITGASSADFSNVMNGLVAVQDEADETIQKLLATGQWTLSDEVEVDQEMPLWLMGEGGKITLQELHAAAKYRFLKPTGNNPFKGAQSTYQPTGSGDTNTAGGGGGSSSKGMTEVQRMLDRMAQIQAIQNHTKSLYAAQASMFAETGQLQGVIAYYEKERAAIEAQNKTLQANLDEMEPWLEKKKAEVAALDVSSAEYEEASSDLKALQERHQEYTLALINNTAEVDKLTDAIKEQRDAIRQMEIDLRNTILDAIKDREALNERMLEGTIETENTILDLIKKRYEKERDMILENTEKQIDALQRERDLLSEQLELRKQQAEEEDKLAKLAELEAKYARIVADPTRQKEALSIQKEIQDLRDEIAWDTAEKEVAAQQDSIDQQIDSLEDYKEYINNYYEYLFEHPQQLIDEMKEIIKGADEEIIAWLEANDEEYANATEATKEKTVNSWKSMLLDMRGELELFWDEVEEIIAGGDDYIVNFLIENSAKYREAGKLQAEAYVDEWLKQLDDLRKAYELVTGVEPDDYVYIAPAEGSSSGGGGGGDGDGKTSGLKWTDTTLNPTIKVEKSGISGGNRDFLDIINKSPTRFGETVLNASPTIDMDTIGANEATLLVPSMPNLGDTFGSSVSTVSIGDIIVNVDHLNDDASYEEVGEKVGGQIVNYLNRGSVVGGIRLNGSTS